MYSRVKLLFVLVGLVGIIRLTSAASGIEVVESAPGDPNKCYRSKDNLTVAIGENKILPNCMRTSCSKHGDTMTLHFVGCGTVAGNDKCKKVEDKTKPHPDCCPKLKCT